MKSSLDYWNDIDRQIERALKRMAEEERIKELKKRRKNGKTEERRARTRTSDASLEGNDGS
jgi:hypothetical protein